MEFFSECKQKEIGEVLDKNRIDVVTGQENEDTKIVIEGY